MADQKQVNPDVAEFEDPLCNYEPAKFDDAIAQALAERPVADIQIHPYSQVTSRTTVRRAMQALSGLRISSLLVIDHDKLTGVFTERDVLERVADRFEELCDRPISEVMTTNPVVVRDTDPLGAALAAIVAGGYRHVPVINWDDKVVGIVSPRRVVSALSGVITPSESGG
ncbi:MAG: CBS domain-containing protein [Planctomycetales bacterium]|nr:CBS domain-containing protein [Planctomycetales bacterium]